MRGKVRRTPTHVYACLVGLDQAPAQLAAASEDMDEEVAPIAVSVDGGNYVLVSAHNVVIAVAYTLPEPMLVLRKGMALQVWILIGAGAGAPYIEHGQAGLCEGHRRFGEGVRAQRRHPAEHVRKRGPHEVASREATV